MRIKILFTIIIFPLLSLAQNSPENSFLLDEVGSLKRELKVERSKVNELNSRNTQLERNFKELSESLQAQIKNNMEVQSQNEKAVNITLDEFSKKFDDQNKTVEGVKAQLEKQWSQQILFFVGCLAVSVLVLIWGIRYSTKKALEKQQKSWNDFNEYIIKNK